MLYEEKIIETIPVGPLGLIPLKGCEELVGKVDKYLVDWRNERESEHKTSIAFSGYQRDSYIIGANTPRFGSGEAKGEIKASVRGDDLYLIVDVCNYSQTYSLCGMVNHMSPDDHYQDLKRVIAAAGGKARRINVIMPFLYESRQHKRSGRESLDCALALEELVNRLNGLKTLERNRVLDTRIVCDRALRISLPLTHTIRVSKTRFRSRVLRPFSRFTSLSNIC